MIPEGNPRTRGKAKRPKKRLGEVETNPGLEYIHKKNRPCRGLLFGGILHSPMQIPYPTPDTHPHDPKSCKRVGGASVVQPFQGGGMVATAPAKDDSPTAPATDDSPCRSRARWRNCFPISAGCPESTRKSSEKKSNSRHKNQNLFF